MGSPSDSFAVDLALVLAVDCSSSVKAEDFRLQMDGIAAALRHPALQGAIAAGEHRRIALSLVLWSGLQAQAVSVDWRVLQSRAELDRAAIEIETAERKWLTGGTALAAAITYAADWVAAFPLTATRRVIDVSGDGPDNVTGDTAAARDRAVARGITINGLPVTNGSKLLPLYYRSQVIGGDGAFIETAENMHAFHDAILRKLLREIGHPGV